MKVSEITTGGLVLPERGRKPQSVEEWGTASREALRTAKRIVEWVAPLVRSYHRFATLADR